MAKKENERKQLIEDEKARLQELFSEIPCKKNLLAIRLIEKAAFMHVTLEELQDYINKHGVKEKYKNGANQSGYKDSVEAKTYANMIKNYTSIIKQLNEMLPNGVDPKDDGFDKFGDD